MGIAQVDTNPPCPVTQVEMVGKNVGTGKEDLAGDSIVARVAVGIMGDGHLHHARHFEGEEHPAEQQAPSSYSDDICHDFCHDFYWCEFSTAVRC